MKKPEIYAVQHGNRRVEYAFRRDWMKTLLIFAFGFFLAVVCFAEGVDRGTTAGIEACRSGNSVLVDPAVGGAG